jgi:hypothetical protein
MVVPNQWNASQVMPGRQSHSLAAAPSGQSGIYVYGGYIYNPSTATQSMCQNNKGEKQALKIKLGKIKKEKKKRYGTD